MRVAFGWAADAYTYIRGIITEAEEAPERMYRVRSVTGVPDKENEKERVKLYRKFARI